MKFYFHSYEMDWLNKKSTQELVPAGHQDGTAGWYILQDGTAEVLQRIIKWFG